MCDIILKEVEVQYTSTQKPPASASSERYFLWAFKSFDYLLVAIMAQIKQYSNLISLTADQLQDLKARVKELDNGDYSSELNAVNQAQAKLYEALKALETD
jgi:DNA repair ATPase RecN